MGILSGDSQPRRTPRGGEEDFDETLDHDTNCTRDAGPSCNGRGPRHRLLRVEREQLQLRSFCEHRPRWDRVRYVLSVVREGVLFASWRSALEGMSAADFGLYPYGDWQIVGINPQNGFLNAGSGNNLLLAVGGCPTGPIIAANLSVVGTVGGVRLGIGTPLPPTAATVDCTLAPVAWSWPQYMRFVGFKTDGSPATLQDHGNGCTTDPVDESSWGTIKSLYRE